MLRFPSYRQPDQRDCGPTCLKMIGKYYGKSFSTNYLRKLCETHKHGVTLLGISNAAEKIGFKTLAVKIDYETLVKEAILPCIVHWQNNHFVVVYKVSNRFVWISDPVKGLLKISKQDFIAGWAGILNNGEMLGICLLLEPTLRFEEDEITDSTKINIRFLYPYLRKYRKLFFQLLIGLVIASFLQIIVPFLTQSVVDIGISTKDINFILLVLIGQAMIFAGSLAIDFIRSWILLHINTRINISLLTDFFIKIMRLPMSFFDKKMTGDILQRLSDYGRVQSFFTGNLLTIVFSLINFTVFTFLVINYSWSLFSVFFIGNSLYFCWIFLFLRVRRSIDFKRFSLASQNQSYSVELIQGMQEIKLNNCERQKRWKWEELQAKLFKVSIKSLFINQVQSSGALLLNQGKNIVLTYISAKAVIDGDLTLGGMMAVQYIIGQLNGPVNHFIQFIQSLQDAKISLERINEVQEREDEESMNREYLNILPNERTIRLKDVFFRYDGTENAHVLKDLSLVIPQGKITAIVGMSGSGKTTLLKLLLRCYDVSDGGISVGDTKLYSISPSFWRSKCGVVMQDGYIFSDTIAGNIAVGEDVPDLMKLQHAINVANIQDVIDNCPAGIYTKIGSQGQGLSAGQKQRILIARAVYKDPEYLFLDEATNSLDATNERAIMDHLSDFLQGKTVVIVAHRLSTIRNADQIVVLSNGEISEMGTHEELLRNQAQYYKLVKNQLEIVTA